MGGLSVTSVVVLAGRTRGLPINQRDGCVSKTVIDHECNKIKILNKYFVPSESMCEVIRFPMSSGGPRKFPSEYRRVEFVSPAFPPSLSAYITGVLDAKYATLDV